MGGLWGRRRGTRAAPRGVRARVHLRARAAGAPRGAPLFRGPPRVGAAPRRRLAEPLPGLCWSSLLRPPPIEHEVLPAPHAPFARVLAQVAVVPDDAVLQPVRPREAELLLDVRVRLDAADAARAVREHRRVLVDAVEPPPQHLPALGKRRRAERLGALERAGVGLVVVAAVEDDGAGLRERLGPPRGRHRLAGGRPVERRGQAVGEHLRPRLHHEALERRVVGRRLRVDGLAEVEAEGPQLGRRGERGAQRVDVGGRHRALQVDAFRREVHGAAHAERRERRRELVAQRLEPVGVDLRKLEGGEHLQRARRRRGQVVRGGRRQRGARRRADAHHHRRRRRHRPQRGAQLVVRREVPAAVARTEQRRVGAVVQFGRDVVGERVERRERVDRNALLRRPPAARSRADGPLEVDEDGGGGGVGEQPRRVAQGGEEVGDAQRGAEREAGHHHEGRVRLAQIRAKSKFAHFLPAGPRQSRREL